MRKQFVAADRSIAALRLSFSPDGTTYAVARHNQLVQLWRTADGLLLREFPAAGDALAFAPDGRTVAIEQLDDTIALLDLESGQLLRSFPAHRYGVTELAFTSDGQTLVSASSGERTVKLWRVNDGTLLQAAQTQVRAFALSPTEQLVASAGLGDVDAALEGIIEMIDIRTGKSLRSWSAHTSLVYAFAFSPDGGILASGPSRGTIRLWRIKLGCPDELSCR